MVFVAGCIVTVGHAPDKHMPYQIMLASCNMVFQNIF